MHRLAISKIAAVTLLALILLPFTAPFKTYELSSPQDQSFDQLVKAKFGADDKLVGVTESSPIPQALNIVVSSAPRLINQVDQPQVHSTVLRL